MLSDVKDHQKLQQFSCPSVYPYVDLVYSVCRVKELILELIFFDAPGYCF
jgi:hypothetical protein